MTTSSRDPVARTEPRKVGSWAWPSLRAPISREETPAGPSPEEAAYHRGIQEGFRRAEVEAEARMAGCRQALRAAADALQHAGAEQTERLAEHVQVMALAVARQLVHRVVEEDPAVVRDLVTRALELVPPDDLIKIRLHPVDFEALGLDDDGQPPAWAPEGTHWSVDPAVGRGGCVVEAGRRLVDGQLDRCLLSIFERVRRG